MPHNVVCKGISNNIYITVLRVVFAPCVWGGFNMVGGSYHYVTPKKIAGNCWTKKD